MSVKTLMLALRVPTEQVTVDGVGTVTIRGLTAAGRDEWEQRIVASKGKPVRNIRASLVSLCMFDSDTRVFESSEIEALGELPAQVVDRLYDIASKLSGMGQQDKDANEGNSQSAP